MAAVSIGSEHLLARVVPGPGTAAQVIRLFAAIAAGLAALTACRNCFGFASSATLWQALPAIDVAIR
jgi:hypothetical protein